MPRKGEIIDLRKMRYGKLTVTEYDGKHGRRHKWLCRCDCGNFVSVCRDHLINGHTRSCGCLAGENKCSEDDKRLNFVYRNLINRCYSKSCKEYPYYGARGIVICDEWKISDERGSGLNNFRKWSHDNGYKKGLTLDRIDNNKGYSPDNCRWVYRYVQANNKRNNHYIKINGEIGTVANMARKYNIDYWNTLHYSKGGKNTKYPWLRIEVVGIEH